MQSVPDVAESRPGPLGLTLQLFLQKIDDLSNGRIDFHSVLYQSARMEDGPVVAAAKRFTNRIEGAFGQLPGKEHGDLPWKGDVPRPPFAGHVGQANIEMV